MFSINSAYPDEVVLIHKLMNSDFVLLLKPSQLYLGDVKISVVIRTLNEALYLESLLKSIANQHAPGLNTEIILVDSGSTDGTLEIAQRHGCRILGIKRDEFSFGRSLNMGCSAAIGDILVIISGHCVPNDENWLRCLCQPIFHGQIDYTYGRQIGGPKSHHSEKQIFAKYFPVESRIPQNGFFCNNANSALSRRVWEQYRFDEDLTGLEDMELAQRLVRAGSLIAYVADATVIHYHNENWSQIRRRFERESIALQKIMPNIHISLLDTLRYITASIFNDCLKAFRQKPKANSFVDIVRFRYNQYIGTWKGNHLHRKLSHAEKEIYFYPN
jgi:glycosyltransferase involved in cell wall biosynthesis